MKSDRHVPQESILLEKIQGLSLDQLEIGKLIGKGCNAAVHEARLKTAQTGKFSQMSHVMRKPAFGVVQPGKTQTGPAQHECRNVGHSNYTCRVCDQVRLKRGQLSMSVGMLDTATIPGMFATR